MNVKCPNCRFKFDVNPTDVNEQNEVNCTCQRCGKAFTSQYVAPVSEQPTMTPNAQPSPSVAPTSPAISQEQEADLYYAIMKRMEAGQHEEAGICLAKLLELNPNEPIYLSIKEQLDNIKQSYLLATKCIQSGNLDQAEAHIKNLLAVNPNEPMYQKLWNRLVEANRLKAQQEELRQQEEQLKREEEQRKREEEQRKREEEQRKREEEQRKREEEQPKHNNTPPISDDDEEKLYQSAIYYQKAGLNEAASHYLKHLLEKDPDNPKYLELNHQLIQVQTSETSKSGCAGIIILFIISLATLFTL